MSDQPFTCLGFSPLDLGADLAIAAARAGGTGVLDAGLSTDRDRIAAGLARLADPVRGARGPFGLHLARLSPELLDLVAEARGLTWLSVEARGLDAFFAAGGTLPEGLPLWAEITGRDRPPWHDRVTGLVLKGNEAGGFVGEESAFILAQHWRGRTDLPLVVRGGMSPQVAAALAPMGVAGGIFDAQLLCLAESPAPEVLKSLIAPLSGTETVAAGDPAGGAYFRLLSHPKCDGARAFVAAMELAPEAALRAQVADQPSGWRDPATGILPLGQDVAFAGPYAEQHGTVARLFAATRAAIDAAPAMVAAHPPIAEDSPLARELGTRFPIIQGPMTRVSDRAAFAAAIADGGALPMLALALMQPPQVSRLMEETATALGDRSWGVGFLGFLPRDQLEAQIAAVLPHAPDFAIIAGGRPDQATELEARGIPAFLHLPSAKLVPYYIANGARRFIFEGRECGGHIGPISSFTLWSLMTDAILAEVAAGHVKGEDVTCIFAGGIHDALSSAMVQLLTAPLAAAGVKIGILMGSAYVFTREIVETGAVLPAFQETIRDATDTVNLTTGPGHVSRGARTPFVEDFLAAQKRLKADPEVPEEEVSRQLDAMILGTLRAAAKGQMRTGAGGALEEIGPEAQARTGMYMIGQVASLRDDFCTVSGLHLDVTDGAAALLKTPEPAASDHRPADIAIIGLSAALPGARDAETFWANILAGRDSVTEVPRHRWDWRLYFDPEKRAADRIYSKWGGFLEDLAFDPTRYGITPKSLKSVDPMQLMGLMLAEEALADAGYAEMEKGLKDRTSVVIGTSGGSGDVGLQYTLRAELPRFAGDLPEGVADRLPEWSEDTFAGILLNVISGRVSNRLDLGGANFTLDAACASSLAALYQSVAELRAGRADLALAGGIDTQQSPFSFMCFAQTGALSPTGRCRSFDAASDGIAISEGIVMVALKRLEDAERDGDRIYAVVKGVGAGSDGRAKALNAPEPAGQFRAMERAYAEAGYSAETVQLFEAHGTGTVAGDTAELESTGRLMAAARPHQAVIGSVKTNIGHTKAAAGLAGLLKVTLALHHRVLPPHRGVEVPNPVLADGAAPFHLLEAAQPWLSDGPRRASVSAFGFGGTNFHATLEAYEGEYRADRRDPVTAVWPVELALLAAGTPADLAEFADEVRAIIAANQGLAPRDLSASLAVRWQADAGARAAIVFEDLAALDGDLAALVQHLTGGTPLPPGITYSAGPAEGPVAALFPGQGSQYPFMGQELAVYFPEMAAGLEEAGHHLKDGFTERFGQPFQSFLFPPALYDEAARKAAAAALTETDVAQPALGAVETAMWRLLSDGFGLKPAMFGGHSYGEFTALSAAGAFGLADLCRVSAARGRLIVDAAKAAGSELGTMLAIQAPRPQVEAELGAFDGLVVANHNAPDQVIVSGPVAAIAAVEERFAGQGHRVTRLPVAAAFHSPLMAPARDGLAEVIAGLDWAEGATAPVYSNHLAAPHGTDPRDAMAAHLVSPVDFVGEIRAMHDAGARVFVEIGPKTILSGLVGRILEDRPHRCVALDGAGGGLKGCLAALGALSVAGQPLEIARLFRGRDARALPLDRLASHHRHPPMPKHGWWINGSGVRPAHEPPRQIGVTVETRQAAPQAFSFDPPTPKERPFMFNRPLPPGGPPDGKVSTAYFELVAHALDNARSVAMAELGLAPDQSASDSTVPAPAVPAQPTPAPAPVPSPPAAAQPAPAPAMSAPVPQATPAAGPIGAEGLKALLLDVVSDKTGYDAAMLAFDQSLEAELGIDSIKRVDVVAGLLDVLPPAFAKALGDAERAGLSTARTLDEMMAILTRAETSANFNLAGAGSRAGTAAAPSRPQPRPEIARYILRTEAAADPGPAGLTPGRFLITPGGGLAALLAERLTAMGVAAEILPDTALGSEPALLDWIHTHGERLGPFAGLIHLAPLDAAPLDPAETGPEAWQDALFLSEKSLFLLLQTLTLKDRAHVLGASGLGGDFGRNTTTALSLQGGALGFLKSLALERPGLRARAVDLDPGQGKARADQILEALQSRDGRVEIGYPGGVRTLFRPVADPLPARPEATPPRTILATGGARGITAECLRPLARPGTVLILTGRRPLPEQEAPELTALLTEQDLVRHFAPEGLARARARAAAILGAREVAANIADLKARGARVVYVPMDVTDAAVVAATLTRLTAEYGPIEGLVHGAGVIEDARLEDITPDSWDRVVGTKVLGLLTLLKHLPLADLKLLAVFTSVSGRFGNAGQTAYATANELLARLATGLAPRLAPDAAVRAIAWGPWGPTQFGAGMVTPEIEARLAAQGIALVCAEAGRELFAAETHPGGPVEIVCGEGPWEAREAGTALPAPGLLGPGGVETEEARRRLSLLVDPEEPYLQDHRIDGRPVLPMAMALEIMGQAIRRAFGDDQLPAAITQAQLFHGIVFDGPARMLTIEMEETAPGQIAARLLTPGAARPHYAAIFAPGAATLPHPLPITSVPATAVSLDAATVYATHLFHGPVFHGIEGIEALWEEGIRARILSSRPADLLAHPDDTPWIFDPLVVDTVAQLPLVWSSALQGRFALPVTIGRIARHAAALPDRMTVAFRVLEATREAVTTEAHVLGPDGQPVLSVEGMRHALRPGKPAIRGQANGA